MNHGLLLFFNHPFRPVRLFLEKFYRDRFAKIHTLTPPENSAKNSDENVTYFYQGSYNFGGAFSYLLTRPDLFEGMDYVTILHDDVITHSAFPGIVEKQLADSPDSLSPPIDPSFYAQDWPWDSRMIARAFFPRHPIMGDGNEGALREMKELYEQSPGARGEATQMKMASRDLLNLGMNGALARWLQRQRRSLAVDFEVPLYKANSDFFIVRRDKFNTFCHDAGVLTRCGLFAEVAIPTALRWLGEYPKEFGPEQLDWSRLSGELNRKHFQIDSLSDIPIHFAHHPQKVAVHPIKVSKLL